MVPSPILRPPRAVLRACVAGSSLVSGGLAWSQAGGDPLVSLPARMTGQTHSACGGGAGGYIAGLVGLGVQAPVWGRLKADSAEVALAFNFGVAGHGHR